MKENERNISVEEIMDIWSDAELDNKAAINDGMRDLVVDTNWDMLSNIVSMVCLVDKETLLGCDRKVFNVQCRWLLWLSYRHMTNATYRHIRNLAICHGAHITTDGIRKGVEKMTMMAKNDYEWKQRWDIIYDVIKRKKELVRPLQEKVKVVVIVPSNVEVEIRKQQ